MLSPTNGNGWTRILIAHFLPPFVTLLGGFFLGNLSHTQDKTGGMSNDISSLKAIVDGHTRQLDRIEQGALRTNDKLDRLLERRRLEAIQEH